MPDISHAPASTGRVTGTPDVLFVTRKWAPAMGGMETYCHRLTDTLAEMAAVEVIALPGRADGMPPSAGSLLGFPITVIRRMLALRAAPRVVHLGDMALWPIGLAARAVLPTARIVLSAHGTDVAYHRRGGLKGQLYGTYMRLGARMLRKARVIANSAATRDVAAETGWRNAAVIPLATDMARGICDGAHDGTILFAGRLVERKGCGWFIKEVLPLLPDTIRLRVAGTGWDDAETSALASNRVEFLGRLAPSELAEAYRRAMCVVVPNIEPASGEYEGFGLVAAEAAAAGGLVLASDHGGLTDAVRDGVTGYLLPAGKAAAWARRICEIGLWSPQERSTFLDASSSAASEHYSWDRVARETCAVYEDRI